MCCLWWWSCVYFSKLTELRTSNGHNVLCVKYPNNITLFVLFCLCKAELLQRRRGCPVLPSTLSDAASPTGTLAALCGNGCLQEAVWPCQAASPSPKYCPGHQSFGKGIRSAHFYLNHLNLLTEGCTVPTKSATSPIIAKKRLLVQVYPLYCENNDHAELGVS